MSLLFKKRGLKYADNHVYSRLHRAGRKRSGSIMSALSTKGIIEASETLPGRMWW